MQDFIVIQKKALESEGVNFTFAPSTVNHLGRSKDVELIELETTGRGRYSSEVAAGLKFFIPAYNTAIENNAKTEIESDIAKEQEIALQASQATSKELQDLREQLTKVAEENDAKTAASEKARKKPLLQITAWFGVVQTFLIGMFISGMTFFNMDYFFGGGSLHEIFIWGIAALMGSSYVYFGLSKNTEALQSLVLIMPFDLVIAVLIKTILGDELIIDFTIPWEQFNFVGSIFQLVFLFVYGFQTYHIGISLQKLYNPKKLSKKEEEEHMTNVLDSIL